MFPIAIISSFEIIVWMDPYYTYSLRLVHSEWFPGDSATLIYVSIAHSTVWLNSISWHEWAEVYFTIHLLKDIGWFLVCAIRNKVAKTYRILCEHRINTQVSDPRLQKALAIDSFLWQAPWQMILQDKKNRCNKIPLVNSHSCSQFSILGSNLESRLSHCFLLLHRLWFYTTHDSNATIPGSSFSLVQLSLMASSLSPDPFNILGFSIAQGFIPTPWPLQHLWLLHHSWLHLHSLAPQLLTVP